MHLLVRICATKQSRTKSLATSMGTIPKNMPTNFQLKRLKLKLDIVEKPENRVHKLTDSNGARCEASRGSRSSGRSARLIQSFPSPMVVLKEFQCLSFLMFSIIVQATSGICRNTSWGNVRICQFMHSIFRYFYDI